MKRIAKGLTSAALPILFRSFIMGLGAVPGFYFALAGFNYFLVESVFSGNQSSFADAGAFLLIVGLGVHLWAVVETVLLAFIFRLGTMKSAFETLGNDAEDLARNIVFPLLPRNTGKSLFQRISGKVLS